jgi:putative membrane protein|tara:strand:- start:128 stop:565 length:438 start_codon:yes stop_codon:yes gene_type:complete
MYYELVRLLHFAAIFTFAGALVIENMAIKPQITGEDARNLVKVDAVYGISALFVLTSGLTLWLWVGKPSEFYSSNPIFHAKLGLFTLMALCAIAPTIFFNKHSKSEEEVIEVALLLRVLLKFQLVLLVLIPVLALLMARGTGISS